MGYQVELKRRMDKAAATGEQIVGHADIGAEFDRPAARADHVDREPAEHEERPQYEHDGGCENRAFDDLGSSPCCQVDANRWNVWTASSLAPA